MLPRETKTYDMLQKQTYQKNNKNPMLRLVTSMQSKLMYKFMEFVDRI